MILRQIPDTGRFGSAPIGPARPSAPSGML